MRPSSRNHRVCNDLADRFVPSFTAFAAQLFGPSFASSLRKRVSSASDHGLGLGLFGSFLTTLLFLCFLLGLATGGALDEALLRATMARILGDTVGFTALAALLKTRSHIDDVCTLCAASGTVHGLMLCLSSAGATSMDTTGEATRGRSASWIEQPSKRSISNDKCETSVNGGGATKCLRTSFFPLPELVGAGEYAKARGSSIAGDSPGSSLDIERANAHLWLVEQAWCRRASVSVCGSGESIKSSPYITSSALFIVSVAGISKATKPPSSSAACPCRSLKDNTRDKLRAKHVPGRGVIRSNQQGLQSVCGDLEK